MGFSVYTKTKKEQLKLAPKPFAGGGEGKLYKIEMPKHWAGHVVKLYHQQKLSPKRRQKIEYLLANPPKNKSSLVWVEEAVYDNQGVFLGFVMPFVQGEKLEILCTTNLPRKLKDSWYRFHPDAENALSLRLKACFNLAVAIHQVHAANRYILVDLKPDNIIIQADGSLRLVDLDSVEVVENGQKFFDAPVATPEYTPPEYYQQGETDPTQQQAWDRFSMGVIFYKLLMGIHPFAATFSAPYEQATNLAQKIEHGLYVHHSQLKQYLQTCPPLHHKFNALSPAIQQLFNRCFEEGGTQPQKRPTAHEWCSVLLQNMDSHHHRVLPSKIALPNVEDSWLDIQTMILSPKAFIEKIPIVKEIPADLDYENIAALKDSRSLFIVAFFVFSLIPLIAFQNIATCVILFFIWGFVLYNGYSKRLETILHQPQKNDAQQQETFFKKQQNVYEGILLHIQDYYKDLTRRQKSLINTNNKQEGNLQQEIQRKKEELDTQLTRLDKQAQQLMESEKFEYESLDLNYVAELHSYPVFKDANSFDAELAAIDFAEQEELELLQKRLNKDIKKELLPIDEAVNLINNSLVKKDRTTLNKINRYKEHIKKAKKQTIKKVISKSKRYIQTEAAIISAQTTKKHLHSHGSAIIDLLRNKCRIKSILDIRAISKKEIELIDGKVIPFYPLRYYHISHSGLIEWWQMIKKGEGFLSPKELNLIENSFDKEYNQFAKKARAELKAFRKKAEKDLQKWDKKSEQLTKALRRKNKSHIEEIQEKYSCKKDILSTLNERKDKQEEEIHVRYQKQYKALELNAHKEIETFNFFVKKMFAGEAGTESLISYQNKLKKYQRGLERLEEEYIRLVDKQNIVDRMNIARQYKLKLSFAKHILQSFYLQSFESK